MAGEGGGADRVEIVSRELGSGEAACTEVRIAGVIKKCQLTAVREHLAPERALNDALDAFERNVAYALNAQPPAAQLRAAAPPSLAVSGIDASGGAFLSPMERLSDSVQGVFQPVGSLFDRVRDARSTVQSAITGAAQRFPSRPAASVAPSGRRRRRRRSGGLLRQVAVGGGVFVVVGAGLLWYQARSVGDVESVATGLSALVASAAGDDVRSVDSAPVAQSAAPQARMTAAAEEEIAYWAIASSASPSVESAPPRFRAVARSTNIVR